MPSKKIPISFNEEEEAKVKELCNLMGIYGVYGDFAKAVKFGITLALSTIKNPEKVYTTLNKENMKLFFESVSNYEISYKLVEQSKNLQKEAQKYNPEVK